MLGHISLCAMLYFIKTNRCNIHDHYIDVVTGKIVKEEWLGSDESLKESLLKKV